ncbi:hypothetical protein EOD42_25560 [Rhodovarius crocodyli]|uniref:Uncharacterized protein n=1 Tax=Rhodovarius crocodyli TaxID=1979269 RepID=A0A437LV29_9PROT|nr:hypothetical protein [Rhodovarius crocodyli]RVT89270.1 hypothetical protein EOD42_25560 [Rhodovarius crocodyli]
MPDAPKPATAFDPTPLIEAAKKAMPDLPPGVQIPIYGYNPYIQVNLYAILAWGERDAEQQARITTDAARIQGLREALADMEAACEERAALTAADAYIALLHCEGASDALRKLDRARGRARALLSERGE